MQKDNTIEYRLLILEQMISDIYDKLCDKKVCPVCKSEIRLYVPTGFPPRRRAKCPVCNLCERHRFLWLYLEHLYGGREMVAKKIGSKLLHFAPEKGIWDIFSTCKELDYYPVDIDPDRYQGRVINSVDITDIPYDDNYFNAIICSHLLEHIPDDRKAISELHRVLKPGGNLFIMIPQKNTAFTFENFEYNTDELRQTHFGQYDHVRWYGLDFTEKLTAFNVQIIKPLDFLTKEQVDEYAANGGNIFHCRKK